MIECAASVDQALSFAKLVETSQHDENAEGTGKEVP
jgi:hypothetical protein